MSDGSLAVHLLQHIEVHLQHLAYAFETGGVLCVAMRTGFECVCCSECNMTFPKDKCKKNIERQGSIRPEAWILRGGRTEPAQ